VEKTHTTPLLVSRSKWSLYTQALYVFIGRLSWGLCKM